MLKKQRNAIHRGAGSMALDIVIYTVMVLTLLVCLVPFLYMLALSLSDAKAIVNNQVSLWPVGFNLGSYEQIVTYPHFFRAYGNTFFYTAAGTAISLLMTMLFAYPLSKTFLRGQTIFMKMVIVSMFFSGGLIPTFLTVKSLGLYNNPWVMVILGATSMTNIIISRTFFETNIPNELREAAEIDGCSNTRFFFSIVLPLSTAIIAVMALFFAVTHWNGYFTAMIYVRDKDWQPLQIVMREILMRSEFNAQMLQQGGDTGVLAAQEQRIAEQIKYALIVVASVPVMCIYPFVQKHFVKGVTVGAVKG